MIDEREFASIRAMVEKIVTQTAGRKSDYFITGKVLKRDVTNKCIYMAEFGDQPIPVVEHNYTVTYYDTNNLGKVVKKKAKIEVEVPKPGQLVLVAREMGQNRIPRCLGVIQGKKWILLEDE